MPKIHNTSMAWPVLLATLAFYLIVGLLIGTDFIFQRTWMARCVWHDTRRAEALAEAMKNSGAMMYLLGTSRHIGTSALACYWIINLGGRKPSSVNVWRSC